MKARKKLAVALALLLVTSGSALALGLGQIKVESALNQPLKAEIPVVSASPDELRGLTVSLASSEDFQRAGISRERLQANLKFQVEKRGGQTVIVVTSDKPVNDPALDLLLELNWSNGKLLREFSILLDPPGMPAAGVSRATAVTAPASEKKPVSARPTGKTRAATTAAGSGTASTMASSAGSAAAGIAAGSSYTVRSGDNIWSIAQRSTRSAGEINRMMVAIQRANPDAFFKDNINALKKGAVLRIPDRSEMAEISASDARGEVQRQNQLWSNPEAASPSMMAGNAPSSGNASRAGGSAGSRLELVPPRNGSSTDGGRSGVAGGTGSAAVAGLKQELARAKEALASEQQRSEDMSARVKDLEGIRDKNQRLLELKNAQIAELQAALDKAKAATPASAGTAPALRQDIFEPATAAGAATAAVPASAAAAEAASVAPAGSAAVAVAGTAGTAASAATSPAVTPAASVEAATAATVAQPAETTAASPQQEQPVESGHTATAGGEEAQPWYMQTWAWLVGGLVVVVLLLLGLRSRRGKSADTRSERLSDALAGGEAEHPEGLGEDAEDEYALLEEIEQHPDELSLHLELASLYYAHRNEAKFEGAAEAMYAHVDDPTQPEWQQVRAMGEELCPDHPLFAELHTDGDSVTQDQVAHDESSLANLVDEDQEHGKDGQPDHGKAGGYNFDFDLTPSDRERNGGDGDAATRAAGSEAEDEDLLSLSTLADPDSGDEFDVDQVLADARGDDSDTDATDADATAEEPDDDFVAADDESGSGRDDEEFSSDPVDTKLDLARAYQDMGDDEGARAMLEEVLNEGNEAQKDAARKLLDDLR